MPQLDAEYFAPQLFWLVVSFVLLYLLMSRVALPRIAGVIEERRDKIADDLDKAQALKKEADAALEAYEKALAEAHARAQAITAEARANLKAEGDALRMELDRTLAERASEAEARIRQAKAAALANLKPAAAEVAAAIVSKLLGETIPQEEAERAVGATLRREETQAPSPLALVAEATKLAQRAAGRLRGNALRPEDIESAVQAELRIVPAVSAPAPEPGDPGIDGRSALNAPSVELAIKALRRVLGDGTSPSAIAEAINAEFRRR